MFGPLHGVPHRAFCCGVAFNRRAPVAPRHPRETLERPSIHTRPIPLGGRSFHGGWSFGLERRSRSTALRLYFAHENRHLPARCRTSCGRTPGQARPEVAQSALHRRDGGVLARHAPDEVTEAMNQVVDHLNEAADPFVHAAAQSVLSRVEWWRSLKGIFDGPNCRCPADRLRASGARWWLSKGTR